MTAPSEKPSPGRARGAGPSGGIVAPVPTARANRPPAPPDAGPRPDPGPQVITPAPPSRSLKDRFDEVDAALGELVRGRIAFNAPERMAFQERRTITLLASPEMDAPALSEELRERIGGDQPIQVEALQVAPLMEAQLQGAPAFDVTPLTPARQPVSRATPTEWRWDVRANQTGTQTLHLTMNAVVTIDGERFPRSLGVLNRDIVVEITATQRFGAFLERNWQWLAGTIIVPLVVWFWSNRKRPRRRPAKDAETAERGTPPDG